MAKRIELEYFSMIDQVVFACDENLNILYNNYHERFYEGIMKKVEDYVSIKQLRAKGALRLDKFFVHTKKRVQAESRTMKNLLKMYENFEFDSMESSKIEYYRSVNILDILESLEAYERKIKRNASNKTIKQLKMEKRRNQLASVQLEVNLI